MDNSINESIKTLELIKSLEKSIKSLSSLKKELESNDITSRIIQTGYVVQTSEGNYHLDKDFCQIRTYKTKANAEAAVPNGKARKVLLILED